MLFLYRSARYCLDLKRIRVCCIKTLNSKLKIVPVCVLSYWKCSSVLYLVSFASVDCFSRYEVYKSYSLSSCVYFGAVNHSVILLSKTTLYSSSNLITFKMSFTLMDLRSDQIFWLGNQTNYYNTPVIEFWLAWDVFLLWIKNQ